MTEFFAFLAMLIVAHALADYPLQGDFLARAKNPWAPIPGVPWYWAMGSHAAIHGGFVWFVTGVWWMGLAEFVLHTLIDLGKCRGLLDFNEDQFGHLACKVTYAAMAAGMGVAIT